MSLGSREARLVRSSRNILLQRLSPSDQLLLEPFIVETTASRGAVIAERGQPIEAVYFPDSSIFSLVEQFGQSPAAEIAVVGREGMLGWPALLGCDQSTHDSVCQARGKVLAISVPALKAVGARSATLWPAMLKFVHIVIVQMARAIASHLQDALERRLARWLLMSHDRVGGDILLVHHDEIAGRLAVRRASITDHLHILEGDRLIRCNRGKILIRDRTGLETRAGDSYGITELHYRNLIAPFGKSLPDLEEGRVTECEISTRQQI